MSVSNHYQVIVVGGGIVGAGIFRDLSLHGIKTLLIDSGDFASQTSERSSKMLHGGIRYLENLDFKLVFEALHEKNLWLKIAPHLAQEMPFFLPVYKNSKRPLWMIRIGLFLYDLLSGFKNSPYKIFDKDSTLQMCPQLQSEGLLGTGLYYDGVIDDAKMNLEIIYDGLLEKKSHALNHCLVTQVKKIPGNNSTQLTQLQVKNSLTNSTFNITADKIVYALGPFTDQFLQQQSIYSWSNCLLPSKGSHLWIKRSDLNINNAVVMTPHDEFGDRVIFVIPYKEKVLVGTTEVKPSGNFFQTSPNQSEIDYLIKNLNLYFPSAKLTLNHIIGQFAGIRPLVKEEGSLNLGKTSREHKIYRLDSETYAIAGGKYTTFRVMGQDISREICHFYSRSYNPDKTQSVLRQKSVILPFEWKLPLAKDLEIICQNEMPKTFHDLVVRRLSVPSRKIWKEKTHVDFDEYFNCHFQLLAKQIHISKDDISNFV